MRVQPVFSPLVPCRYSSSYLVTPDSVGRVSDGPTNADGYNWWQVAWGDDAGWYNGWSAESSSGEVRLENANAAGPICGIDVSSNQGVIDWQKVYASGHTFAFVRATQGGDPAYNDSLFVSNMSSGGAAGVKMGAYDTSLLNITDVVLAAGLPADWTVVLDTSVSNVATVTASGTTALIGANLEIARLIANVPNDAPYGDSQAISLENLSVNNDAIAAVGDSAIQKVVYLGDTDGSGIHSSADAFLDRTNGTWSGDWFLSTRLDGPVGQR